MPTVESVAKEVHLLWAENRTRLNVSIALEARIRTQELEMVTCRRAFDAAAEERETLAARLDALAGTDHQQQHTELGDEVKDLYARLDALERRVVEPEHPASRPAWERDDADDVDSKACTCDGCGLPEDGLRVRNVIVRPSSGLRLCADCATVEIPF